MNTLRSLLLVAVASQSAACFWVTTKHEGEELRKDVNRIDTVVERQEATLGESVKKLKSTLDEASSLLARNSADLGAQFDGLEQENARLTGLVMEAKRYSDEVFTQMQRLEKRLEDMEKRMAEIEGGKVAPVVTQSPDELFDEAQQAHKAKDYNKARELYRKLVIKYPGHGKADDAQFSRGEAYFEQGDYQSAIPEYQALFEKFASSSLADDAMYRAGESAEKLKRCVDARAYYGILRQRHPKSDLAKKARQRETVLKKNSGNKKMCE